MFKILVVLILSYRIRSDKEECIDKCSSNSHCDAGQCVCDIGYILKDGICILTNPCSKNPCTNSTCTNPSPGEYVCDCLPGYKKESSSICVDIDECTEGVNGNPNLKACNNDISTCKNLIGGYVCECINGYKFNQSPDYLINGCRGCCIDINECSEGVMGDIKIKACDDKISKCVNQTGSYTCNCNIGYRFEQAIDYLTKGCVTCCQDINECIEGVGVEKKPACNADHGKCENKVGNYDCNCFPGYNYDKKYFYMLTGCMDCCEDIDECAEQSDNCIQKCIYGTYSQGAPLGVNFTCGCNEGNFEIADNLCSKCEYESWGDYGECEVEICGDGVRKRKRDVKEGGGRGSASCETKEMTETEDYCFVRCIESNCVLSAWSMWNECSVECGGGETERSRTIMNEYIKDACSGEQLIEKMACNTHKCPDVDYSSAIYVFISGGVGVLLAGVFVVYCCFCLGSSDSTL